MKAPSAFRDIEETRRNDNKKFYHQSLTVSSGKIIKKAINKNFLLKQYDKITDSHFEYSLDRNNKLDEVTVFYADFFALQILGHINLYNINHLCLIP